MCVWEDNEKAPFYVDIHSVAPISPMHTHTDLVLIQNEKRNREHFVVSCQVCRKSRSGSHTHIHTQVHTTSTHTKEKKKKLSHPYSPRATISLADSRNGVSGKEKVISHCLSLNFPVSTKTWFSCVPKDPI